ncbi:MAG: hypothetical protein R3E96_16045 [Planctomycetota bacterium]
MFGVLINQVGTSSTGTGLVCRSACLRATRRYTLRGDTWYFQLWHRENGGQASFSTVAVTF